MPTPPPDPPETTPPPDPPETTPPPPPPPAAAAEAARRPRWKRWLYGAGLAAAALIVFAGAGLGGAEYYTSRPDFCGSCHVMDPYYESWSRDVHGAKCGVRCIDCHYAPGERFTIKAKFKGLSQVASYFSGRYGAGRPRAHVDDESCLRSGCHGDGAFRDKMLPIGEPRIQTRLVGGREETFTSPPSVHFFHSKHLDTAEKNAAVVRDLAETRARLMAAVSGEALARIEQIVTSVLPAPQRRAALDRVASEQGLPEVARSDAVTLMELEHRRIRLDQLAGLNCSACHNFNPALTSHIIADRQVCYTCHFTHEDFNHGTGECLRCHEAPTRSVHVHGPSLGDPAAPSVIMDHQDIIKRGVDCASCHYDVLRGAATVSERDCVHCHDQARYLVDFAKRTTETVRMYHAVHVAQQRAHCFDCHRAIQHGLFEPVHLAADPVSGGFLEPVLNDCQHCHPNHHADQVALLRGTGGIGLAHATPSGMLGSRLNCRACHTEPGAGSKGEAVIRATQQACAACHGQDYLALFDQWKHEIAVYLGELEQRLTRATRRVETADPARRDSPHVAELLAAARHNLELVRNGGGMHNRQYALQLLDTVRRDLSELESLNIE